MGCLNQCCWDADDDISVCQFVFGPDYTDEDTIDQESCWTGMVDNPVTDNCLGCDLGCEACEDTATNIRAWQIDRNGYGYMRPNVSGSRYRDAKNRISDVPVMRDDRDPALFVRRLDIERAGCKYNDEDFACWGEEEGHPCHCFHETNADCEDNGLPLAGMALPGFFRDRFFYYFNGWPRRYPGQFNNIVRGQMDCRLWKQGAAPGFSPERPVGVTDDGGQTQFLGIYNKKFTNSSPACSVDALTACAAYVPGGSDCARGLLPADNCSSVRTSEGPTQTFYCGSTGSAQCNQFEYMRVTNWAPRVRSHVQGAGLRNTILAAVGSPSFPVLFDSIQHQVGQFGNPQLGVYRRTWEADSLDDAFSVQTLEARTRWGQCPVNASIVVTKVELVARAFLLRTERWMIGTTATRDTFIEPFITVDLNIDVGVRATLTEPCSVNGEAVELNYDANPYFPAVSPTGNVLQFGTPVPSRVEWRGRLNRTSTPKTEARQVDLPGVFNPTNCDKLRDRVGVFLVPPLPGNVEASDPHTFYDGSISFEFGEDSQ